MHIEIFPDVKYKKTGKRPVVAVEVEFNRVVVQREVGEFEDDSYRRLCVVMPVFETHIYTVSNLRADKMMQVIASLVNSDKYDLRVNKDAYKFQAVSR